MIFFVNEWYVLYLFDNLNPGVYTILIETEDGCTHTENVEIIEPPLLNVTAALTTPLTCNDGEITIYAEGGTPPYFYYINLLLLGRPDKLHI